MPHKFRFAVQLASAGNRAQWVDACKAAEDLGYSTVFMPDHFGDQLAPLPALMTVAETTSLRIGTLVLDNDYKHPVVTAKELATMDLLTDGRLEAGIGAGWMRSDYDASGIAYDAPSVRVDRFEEGLQIIKKAFGGETYSHQGKHYTITDYKGRPKPVQQPGPPLLVGGGGRRVLSIAARQADIVGINFNLKPGEVTPELGSDGTAAKTAEKIEWVKQAAGARFDELELNVLVFFCAITNDRIQQASMIGPMFGLTPEQALEMPYALVGTTDEVCDDLVKRRELYGISYICISAGAYKDFGGVVSKLGET